MNLLENVNVAQLEDKTESTEPESVAVSQSVPEVSM